MLDHVTANVGDIEQAKRFYSQALAPLGYSLAMEFEGGAGFGTGEGMADFWLGSSSERGATHVAFVAPETRRGRRFLRSCDGRGREGQRPSRAPPALPRKTSTRRTCTIRTATTSRR
jgi:catechol 2,3-dioxygenase-like lactoylglutathione lyase family enzyme